MKELTMRCALPFVLLLSACAALPLIAADAPTPPGATKTTPAKRPFMGIRVDENPDGNGVVISHVVHATTAHKMGVLKGDILQTIDGKPINNRQELKQALAGIPVEAQVTVALKRRGQELTLKGVMQAVPGNKEVSQLIKQQQQLASEANKAIRNTNNRQATLANALLELNETLADFPARLDVLSKEFKQVYPDGEFSIQLQINIRTAKDGATLDLSPVLDVPVEEETEDETP